MTILQTSDSEQHDNDVSRPKYTPNRDTLYWTHSFLSTCGFSERDIWSINAFKFQLSRSIFSTLTLIRILSNITDNSKVTAESEAFSGFRDLITLFYIKLYMEGLYCDKETRCIILWLDSKWSQRQNLTINLSYASSSTSNNFNIEMKNLVEEVLSNLRKTFHLFPITVCWKTVYWN